MKDAKDPSVEVGELNTLLKDKTKNILLIDVRSEDQHKEASIPGAVNLSVEEIKNDPGRFAEYEQVFIHCNRGGMSQRACDALKAEGFDNVVNVSRGITQWKEEGFELEKR